jgi:hypothetical protein
MACESANLEVAEAQSNFWSNLKVCKASAGRIRAETLRNRLAACSRTR